MRTDWKAPPRTESRKIQASLKRDGDFPAVLPGGGLRLTCSESLFLENLGPLDEIGNPTAPNKVDPWQGEGVGVQMEPPWRARGPSWDRISLGTGWVISGKTWSISEPVFPSETEIISMFKGCHEG